MKISLNWLREFVDLPESASELRPTLDDLGLVVEGIEHVGEGLADQAGARRQREQQTAVLGAARVGEAFLPGQAHRAFHQRRQVRYGVVRTVPFGDTGQG